MIIYFHDDIHEAQVLSLQKKLNGHSRLLRQDGGCALVLASFSQEIPPHWIKRVYHSPDKLYFTEKTYAQGLKDLHVGELAFSKNQVVSIAGPCSVESKEQIFECAKVVKSAKGQILRGGVYKPRTSPYDFQGIGEEGLHWLQEAACEEGLKTITEVMDVRDLEKVAGFVDILQIGARNMQNFSLLKELGQINKPILLKRGLSATYQELLNAAEYVMGAGNESVILCERGIRTFEKATRNTLDISAIPYLKAKTHCPIIVDPSHAIGLREFVPQLAYAALAAGADGLMVEVHPKPTESISDARQTVSPETFALMSQQLQNIAQVFGKNFGG